MIDNYKTIAAAYNQGVSEKFQIPTAMNGSGLTQVLAVAPIEIAFDLQDDQVETIKITCTVEGDHAFDEVFIGFESGLKASSRVFFDAYQDLLHSDKSHTSGETNGFLVDYMRENGQIVATFNKSK
ncbi:hypothetical protein JK159_03375 [Weissella minor]|uniref:hypothetical protein n=1 Tax=Weissella minor TaxID=1620 RepID=UPI001BAE9FF0|nr:hypothetical protein [Weissella minor]MBS0949424.1 hypothetical protein [Weissella minor]